MENRIKHWEITVLTGAFFVTVLLGASRTSTESRKYLNPPPDYIEHFAFGFSGSMADILWLRWIQDSDYCQTYGLTAPTAAPAKTDHSDIFFNPRAKNCDQSWAFKMLDAVTKLAPKFEMPYLAGAMSLSVLVEDYQGASIIFERGVEQFPQNWMLLYRAAYHFLFDRQDYKRGAELLDRAAKAGAPYWLRFLAARAYSRAGQGEVGLDVLRQYRSTLTDEAQIKEVDVKIAEIQKNLAAEKP
jgi:tetratricopeptide (TPR) repeat protein